MLLNEPPLSGENTVVALRGVVFTPTTFTPDEK